jgi:hypothetical protein
VHPAYASDVLRFFCIWLDKARLDLSPSVIGHMQVVLIILSFWKDINNIENLFLDDKNRDYKKV